MPELAIVYICLESHLCSFNKCLYFKMFTYNGKGRRSGSDPPAGPVLHSRRWDKTAACCPISDGSWGFWLVISQQHLGLERRVSGIGLAIGRQQ